MATNQATKRRSPSEGASDASSQDQSSTPGQRPRQSTKSHIRHRASVACASCRERRIRCVVPEGASECTQCKRSGAKCVIKNDDERRRPISKAYMSSLSNRIALLEDMLQERGVVPPPAIHPPKTRHEAQTANHDPSQQQAQTSNSPQSWSASPERDSPAQFVVKDEDVEIPTTQLQAMPFSDDMPWKHPFYGPTANAHLHTGTLGAAVQGPREHDRRASKFIQALSSSTKDHLMGCFWDFYNPINQVVDRKGFEADQESQTRRFYSPFLHITMLALGYRFADREREAVKRLTLGNWESTLHRESKCLLEPELERPTGLTTIQALLLLADLEFGAGRDTGGWLYSGAANRLAFAMGLHVEHAEEDTSEEEGHVRRQVMTACLLFDRRLALLLGRPTSIKSHDIGVGLSLKGFWPSPLESSAAAFQTTDGLVYQYLADLMGLAGKIADSQNAVSNTASLFSNREAERNSYLHAVTVDQQLQSWYRLLPEQLRWTPVNIKTAPLSFFMLHQQYHTCVILLYRPWAKYGALTLNGLNVDSYQSSVPRQSQTSPSKSPFNHGLGSSQSVDNNNRVALSRRMCTQHAVRVARIFWHIKERGFDGSKANICGIQHAETSALTLMSALAHQTPDLDQRSNLNYLNVLSIAIYDMTRIYQPAGKMYQFLKSVLAAIRARLVISSGPFTAHRMQPTSKTTPFGACFGSQGARRADAAASSVLFSSQDISMLDEAMFQQPPSKKRRLGPGSRRVSELAYPTSSMLKGTTDAWSLDSTSNNRWYVDAGKPNSLGKRTRSNSLDELELSGKGNDNTESEELSAALDFDFLINAPTVLDIIERESEQKSPKTPKATTDIRDDGKIESAIFEVMAPVNNGAATSPNTDSDNNGTSNEQTEAQAKEPAPRHPSATTPPPIAQGSNENDVSTSTASDSIDDTTIEEWLAEPPGLTPTSLNHSRHQHHDPYSTSSSPTTSDSSFSITTTGGADITADPAVTILDITTVDDIVNNMLHHNHNNSQYRHLDEVEPSLPTGYELESWMAAAFAINSDGMEHMLSPDSINPSLSELVRSVERAVGGKIAEVAGESGMRERVEKGRGMVELKGKERGVEKEGDGGGGEMKKGEDPMSVRVSEEAKRKRLQALDFLQL